MRRLFLLLVAAAVVLGISLDSALAEGKGFDKKQRMARLVADFYGAAAANNAMFVGSEMCLACHSGPGAVKGYDTSGWRKSFHSRPFKEVADDRYSMVVGMGIVADENRNGVDDFKDGLDLNNHPNFKKWAPVAPVLGYSPSTGYTVKIGDVTLKIFFTWGGNGLWKQRFVAEIPVTDRPEGVSAGKYILPIQYNEVTHEWVTYHPENWYDSNNLPIFSPSTTTAQAAAKGRSFDRKCAGCHFSATSVQKMSSGEYVAVAPATVLVNPDDPTYFDYNRDGFKEMTHIGCETCHGPGSRHILGQGDATLIVRPTHDLNVQQRNELCGRCHVRGKSLAGTYDYPYNEADGHDFLIGDDLYGKYFRDAEGLWPDGKNSRQHHQQFQDLYESSKPTFRFHMVYCSECHDSHVGNKFSLRTFIPEDEGGQSFLIPTRNDDNTLCLACHATHGPFESITKAMVAEYQKNVNAIGQVVSAHTRHPYAPERRLGLSRCTKCHMPKTSKSAINYDVSSHTFEAISPQKTMLFQDKGGMPNSCSVSCHRNIVDIFPNSVDPNIGTWTDPADVGLANWLLQYFGPNGKWWKHDVASPE